MAVGNFLQSVDQLRSSLERKEKKEAAAQQAQALQNIGGELLDSPTGQTDIGRAGSKLIQQGVDPSGILNTLSKVGIDKFVYNLSLKGIQDPNKRDLANKAMKLYNNMNYEKAYQQAKGRQIAKSIFGSSNKTKSPKVSEKPFATSHIMPQIQQWLEDNGVKSTEIPMKVWATDESGEGLFNLEDAGLLQNKKDAFEEFLNKVVTDNYPELSHPDAIGSKKFLVESLRRTILHNPTDNLKVKHIGEDEKEIVGFPPIKVPLNKKVQIDLATGQYEIKPEKSGKKDSSSKSKKTETPSLNLSSAQESGKKKKGLFKKTKDQLEGKTDKEEDVGIYFEAE